MRGLIAWLAGRRTHVRLTSLERINIDAGLVASEYDWDLLFELMLTNPSLQELDVSFKHGCDDAFLISFHRYLPWFTSLTILTLSRYDCLPEGTLLSVCNVVAESSLRKFNLRCCIGKKVNLETVAECLARAIAESSLEEVAVDGKMASALSRTRQAKNLDFSFIQNNKGHLQINHKWRPLLSENLPLGVWPYILEKAHASPETSHGTAGILFFLLRQKPDLVPRNVREMQSF